MDPKLLGSAPHPKRVPAAARTPLFAAIRRAFTLAVKAGEPGAPPVDEIVEIAREARVSRRRFLKTSAVGLAGLAGGDLLLGRGDHVAARSRPFLGDPQLTAPRIVIVGAGLAGLNAAYKLRKRGYRANIYEAAHRSGGRVFTRHGVLAPGLATEFGGEFIDSDHEEMLALTAEFGLELIDTQAPSERDLIPDAYFFDDQHHSEAQVVEAFRPLASRIQTDFDSTGEIVDWQHEGGATALDNMSIVDYLDSIGASGWIRDLLEVAYVTEYGLPSDQQSALNLIFLIGTDVDDGRFEVFGTSDERYKIRGGNQQIVDELARRVAGQTQLDHHLEAMRPRGTGFRLTFARSSGATVDVDADIVVLCLPFSTLRLVDLSRLDLPDWKQRAINALGYGTNAKLLLGFDRRVWRNQGYGGNIFSDEAFQTGWDNSRQQMPAAGGFTIYLGGEAGLRLGEGSPSVQRDLLLPKLERAYPGLTAAHNGQVQRAYWPGNPLSLGSYACYKPGQWTTIAGSEIVPVGTLFFAGEHCSYDFQGFMNGAAETGKQVAEELLATLPHRVWLPVVHQE